MSQWAAVLHGKDDLRVDSVPKPQTPGPHQVLVRMKRVGICGSDVHYWKHGAIGSFVLKAPMIIGHESAGIVAEVGEHVSHLKPGDLVALEPGVPCRRCTLCRTGSYNLCPDIEFFATPPIDGSLQEFVIHDADYCYKLPDHVSLDEGAMCEPLSVGVYACQRAGVTAGSVVAVMGAGPIGLVSFLVAKAFGADRVVITDVSAERLEFAKRLGVVETVNVSGLSDEQVASKIMELAGGHVDVAIDCCGFESATRAAILSTRNGGTVCLVGMHDAEMKLPMFQMGAREVDIKGVFRYRHTYPTCISLIASGKVDVKPLITHRYGIKDILEAFETARLGRGGAIKVMFEL